MKTKIQILFFIIFAFTDLHAARKDTSAIDLNNYFKLSVKKRIAYIQDHIKPGADVALCDIMLADMIGILHATDSIGRGYDFSGYIFRVTHVDPVKQKSVIKELKTTYRKKGIVFKDSLEQIEISKVYLEDTLIFPKQIEDQFVAYLSCNASQRIAFAVQYKTKLDPIVMSLICTDITSWLPEVKKPIVNLRRELIMQQKMCAEQWEGKFKR